MYRLFFPNAPSAVVYILSAHHRKKKRFKEHREESDTQRPSPEFSDHVLKEGLEMKRTEETMFKMHLKNNNRKINTLEEILKTVSSEYLLNDVIAGRNDPMYRLLPSFQRFDLHQSTAQARR